MQIDPETKDLRSHLFTQGCLPSQYASDALILHRLVDHLPSSPSPLSVDLSSTRSEGLLTRPNPEIWVQNRAASSNRRALNLKNRGRVNLIPVLAGHSRGHN